MVRADAASPELLNIYPVLFDVIFVVASISMMTMVIDIVAPMAPLDAAHTFIASVPVMAMMTHADTNAVWTDDHRICHSAGRKVRSAEG
jgi:hypothetical protein